jgi:hypothetical protein
MAALERSEYIPEIAKKLALPIIFFYFYLDYTLKKTYFGIGIVTFGTILSEF